MLEAPAYKALSLSGHRVLARLEIEHGHHGGTDNGRLPVTYADFERYGIERKSIAPALREVQALGFARITERGRPSKSDFGHHPNLFELTYIHGPHGEEPTHEWKRYKSLDEAINVAQQARLNKDVKAVAKSKSRHPKNQIPGWGISHVQARNPRLKSRARKSPLLSRVRKTGHLSISRVRVRQHDRARPNASSPPWTE